MASGAESGLIHVKVLDTLGTLDREIYQYLQKKSPKKAINVARGVNKTAAKDVNPNLYKMKKLGLLHCEDQTKLWSISNGTASEMPNGKTCNTATADVEESNTQEKILAILSKKPPQRALSIAQELKKSSAKDVNPILYKMKDMKLLDHDSDTKLWSIKSEEDEAPRRTDDPTATESPKKYITVTNINICNAASVQLGNSNIIYGWSYEPPADASCVEEADFDDNWDSGDRLSPARSEGDSQSVRVFFPEGEISCTGSWNEMKVTHKTDSGISFGSDDYCEKMETAIQNMLRGSSGSSMSNVCIYREAQAPPPRTSSPISTEHSLQDFDTSELCEDLETNHRPQGMDSSGPSDSGVTTVPTA